MSSKFNEAGLKAEYLISNNKDKSTRDNIKRRLINKEINYLFVVDIFNEGVDIPEVDTVLFLRPTESLTIFLQQLGRGLRLSDNKDFLTVLDFVGNAREEYDFNGKFRALIGKTNSSTKDEIENSFPHLPLGCSIILEKKAKEYILDNINKAMTLNKVKLINKIKNYKHQTNLPLNIKNFTKINNIPLEYIYKKNTWSNLCYQAGILKTFDSKNEKELFRAISKKWLLSRSLSYFKFISKLIETNFNISNFKSENDKLLLIMLYYDFWQDENLFDSLERGIKAIGENKILIKELKEIIEILIDRINYIEKDIELPYSQPLKLYSRYTREQILSAFGKNKLEKKGSSREGVLYIKEKNTELLFVTLEKTEDKYSPTTMYDDYAINENLFHWQSQNSTRPDSPKGKSYIEHEKLNKIILLFVRESNKNKFNSVMPYIFLGKLFYKSHTGSQPMNIIWKLEEEIPHYLRKTIIKMDKN